MSPDLSRLINYILIFLQVRRIWSVYGSRGDNQQGRPWVPGRPYVISILTIHSPSEPPAQILTQSAASRYKSLNRKHSVNKILTKTRMKRHLKTRQNLILF